MRADLCQAILVFPGKAKKNLNNTTLSHSRQARHRCELARASTITGTRNENWRIKKLFPRRRETDGPPYLPLSERSRPMAVADWSQARCKRTRGPFAYSRLSPVYSCTSCSQLCDRRWTFTHPPSTLLGCACRRPALPVPPSVGSRAARGLHCGQHTQGYIAAVQDPGGAWRRRAGDGLQGDAQEEPHEGASASHAARGSGSREPARRLAGRSPSR